MEQDTHLAECVRERDCDVDRDQGTIIRELVDEMKRTPALVEPALSLFSAVRSLERIADHATNVAEETVFLVEGRVLRHKHLFDAPLRSASA